MGRPVVELEVVEVIHETDGAILCAFDTGEEEWIPKFAIHDDSEVWEMGTEGTLVVWEKIAVEKGLA